MVKLHGSNEPRGRGLNSQFKEYIPYRPSQDRTNQALLNSLLDLLNLDLTEPSNLQQSLPCSTVDGLIQYSKAVSQ